MAGKSELIDCIAEKAGLTKAQANDALEATIHCITHMLADGDRVQISGFGTFNTAKRAARQGRNPQTGETIEIAASTGVKFKPGKGLKDAVNG